MYHVIAIVYFIWVALLYNDIIEHIRLYTTFYFVAMPGYQTSNHTVWKYFMAFSTLATIILVIVIAVNTMEHLLTVETQRPQPQ